MAMGKRHLMGLQYADAGMLAIFTVNLEMFIN
ncbi:MAG: hypothetical protein JWR02_2284 [Mucilaginibacter sp.]|nr:hypothetical protein [Mucilaginibacter sp.]